jgi:hypothetical protein
MSCICFKVQGFMGLISTFTDSYFINSGLIKCKIIGFPDIDITQL